MVKAAAKRRKKEEAGESTVQSGFGFTPAEPQQRTRLVQEVFASVAPKYDVMNDIMSLGVHRLWKRDFVRAVAALADETVLDLAGGTGDIAFLMEKARRDHARQNKITVCDINPAMLEMGRKRAMDRGFHGHFDWVEGNAEELPFADNRFDVVTIAFGLRNVTHLSKALRDICRVLKPGGRFFCLEFSNVTVPALQKIYDRYSFSFLPWAGAKVAGNREAYQYLAESIRAFPDQMALEGLMRQAGFAAVRHRNLHFGVAAIHRGVKP